MHQRLNWLRVIDPAELPPLDQGLGHQLHPLGARLDTFKAPPPFDFVRPRPGALATPPPRLDGGVAAAVAAALGVLAVPGLLGEVGEHARMVHALARHSRSKAAGAWAVGRAWRLGCAPGALDSRPARRWGDGWTSAAGARGCGRGAPGPPSMTTAGAPSWLRGWPPSATGGGAPLPSQLWRWMPWPRPGASRPPRPGRAPTRAPASRRERHWRRAARWAGRTATGAGRRARRMCHAPGPGAQPGRTKDKASRQGHGPRVSRPGEGEDSAGRGPPEERRLRGGPTRPRAQPPPQPSASAPEQAAAARAAYEPGAGSPRSLPPAGR